MISFGGPKFYVAEKVICGIESFVHHPGRLVAAEASVAAVDRVGVGSVEYGVGSVETASPPTNLARSTADGRCQFPGESASGNRSRVS